MDRIFQGIDVGDVSAVLNVIDSLVMTSNGLCTANGGAGGGDGDGDAMPSQFEDMARQLSLEPLQCSDGEKAILEGYVTLIQTCKELVEKCVAVHV